LAEEISVDNVAVEKRLEAIRAKFKTKKDFEKALGREGLKEFRLSLYRDLLAGKAEELAVGSKIKVTDAQVRENYETNKAMYLRPRQFKASHILVKVDPSANREEREALLKKAEDLAARAKAGEDFYNLAYYNSDDRSRYVGGDLGYFHEGQTAKEFEDALKKMKSGEVSGLVKTMFGYHIIKLVEVNEPRQFEFDEVKDKIRQSLEKKQRETLYEEWMKGLKSKYQVQRFGN
jgi:parvulin-like peptidyl-prolyl isomerase